jgi:hypothetical protein
MHCWLKLKSGQIGGQLLFIARLMVRVEILGNSGGVWEYERMLRTEVDGKGTLNISGYLWVS